MDAMRFPWLSITPLGFPVEPEVYMMMAVSLGLRIEKTKKYVHFALVYHFELKLKRGARAIRHID